MLLTPRGWRVLCALDALLAITFAIVGQELMYQAAGARLGIVDAVYGSLSLFVFQPPDFPPNAVGMSAFFSVARFLAPAATLYAVADALVLPGARLQARFARSHVVICGNDPVVLALAEKLEASGHQVVLVTDRDPGPLGAVTGTQRAAWLVGDPTRPNVLRAAGLTRAARLYVVGSATVSNAAVLVAAADVVAGRRSPLACYVEESDPDVFDALWMLTLRRPRDHPMKIDFFNVGRLGVRALLRDVGGQGGWTPDQDTPVVIAGVGPFGQELLVEIARRRAGLGAEPLPVVVVDESASAVSGRLRARYGVIDRALDMDCRDVAAEEVDFDWLVHPSAPDSYIEQIFVCYDDEELALRKALATARPPSLRSVVVRVNRNNPLATEFSPDRQPSDSPMYALYGDLIVFSELDRLIDPAESTDDRLELLASAIHANYVRLRLDSGEARSDNEALVAWNILPEKYRSENYDQARDIEAKLHSIGLASARMTAEPEPFAFTEDELERLARMEHERWMRERVDSGWRFGPVRDNEALIHPDLLPYGELSESAREKDRQAVLLIPELLASAGYRIVRAGGQPA